MVDGIDVVAQEHGVGGVESQLAASGYQVWQATVAGHELVMAGVSVTRPGHSTSALP
jgi:hypothetical protein